MTEIMPFPENNIILFYWTAPHGGSFLSPVQSIEILSVIPYNDRKSAIKGVSGQCTVLIL